MWSHIVWCWTMKSTGSPPIGHSIMPLFRAVIKSFQDAIWAKWAKQVKIHCDLTDSQGIFIIIFSVRYTMYDTYTCTYSQIFFG